eukprot:3554702-Rhodomonas_salina.1
MLLIFGFTLACIKSTSVSISAINVVLAPAFPSLERSHCVVSTGPSTGALALCRQHRPEQRARSPVGHLA